MLSPEHFAAAIRAFGESLPTGSKVHCLKVTPTVGVDDQDAKPVLALVLADSDEDFKRLQQVIDRGLSAYSTESGLSGAHMRLKPGAFPGSEMTTTPQEAKTPAYAWSETKWYADCSQCGAQNEVESDACLSGSENTHQCSMCGNEFPFRSTT